MIKVFAATDTVFTSNGDIVINPTKARVKNNDNGDFYLEMACGTEYNEYLASNKILVAPTPQGEQAFRIRDITKSKNKLTVKAWHISYDSENYVIQDSYARDMNCQAAMSHFNAATDAESPFTMYSDITSINTLRIVRKSLFEALQTITTRWGGHFYRDNWAISILTRLGEDNGVTIRYGKNLTDLTAEYNWDNVVTKLMPVGANGILLDEVYVFAPLQYDIPYTKVVSFTQTISEEDFMDEEGNIDTDAYESALKADLANKAQAYVDAYCYPLINYTLKGQPEKVSNIGDTIEVIDERIGVDVMTQVISYEYDAIMERYVSLEFGNFSNTLGDLLGNINSAVTSTVDNATVTLTSTLQSALENAQEKIWGALGTSYCIYEGDKILIVDSLPKESAVNVIKISSAGIGFSSTGIIGPFTTAWGIDGTFNAEATDIVNFTADLIKGGTFKIGSEEKIDIFDDTETLISRIDNTGLTLFMTDGTQITLNQDGISGFDALGNKIFWINNEFHVKKAVIDDLTIGNLRFIPISITGTKGVGLIYAE